MTTRGFIGNSMAALCVVSTDQHSALFFNALVVSGGGGGGAAAQGGRDRRASGS